MQREKNMKTLIVPCCGATYIDGVPNWLARHPNGKFLINECILDSLVLRPDRIIITISKAYNRAYNAQESLIKIFSIIHQNPEILILNDPTSGPAETIYQTLIKKNVNGNIIIKDSDVKLSITEITEPNFVVGIDLMCTDSFPDIRNKAFLKINESKIILDIIEKQINSSKVCFGMYGFSSSEDFLITYESLMDKNYGMNKLYVSNIIAYLIGAKDRVFYYSEAINFEDWGSPYSWGKLVAEYGTYFININLIPSKNDELLKLNMQGARLIFYTPLPSSKYTKLRKMLQKIGFFNFDILTNCQYGRRYLIDSSDDLSKVLLGGYK